MLELSLHLVIADDTSTDEALIAGLPHDLRAIAERIARSWPGKALDASLGAGGRLAWPACLDIDLEHGGHVTLEVRQASISASHRAHVEPANGAVRDNRRSPAHGHTSAQDLDDALTAIVSPERLEALGRDVHFRAALDRVGLALTHAEPARARSAVRLIRSFTGHFVDLVAKDRSGYSVRLADAPTVDPYYVCAEFQQDGARHRVPLPHLLPEADESRRSFSLSPDVVPVLALLEHAIPSELEAVRMAGQAYLVRRREWLSRGRYFKSGLNEKGLTSFGTSGGLAHTSGLAGLSD